mgnify:CR=1 FL=1
MITNENKKLAQWAMEYALKNGCQASKVSLYSGSSTSFEIRDMKIDRLHQASENSLVVQLYVMAVSVRSQPIVLISRNWKSLLRTILMLHAFWQKTRLGHYLMKAVIIKEENRICS